MPEWSKAVKWATLETASSSSRGSGWAPSGPARATKCALRRRGSRPRALPSGHFDHAAMPWAPCFCSDSLWRSGRL
eukprot:scaffold104898_cov60-Phaeocystis_antarctica.AAC.3